MSRARFKKQSKAEFEKERAEILRIAHEHAKDPNNMIPYEDLPWYLEQIRIRLYGRSPRK